LRGPLRAASVPPTMNTFSAFVLSLVGGFVLPASMVNDEVAHCTSGCKPTMTADAACPQITVTVAQVGVGHAGFCECDEQNRCVMWVPCDIVLSFTFGVATGLPGCTFDRDPAVGTWGQTGYTTWMWGCGGADSHGASRTLGYSATCSSSAITCRTNFYVFCPKCAGACP
jgi:hypothetical protein